MLLVSHVVFFKDSQHKLGIILLICLGRCHWNEVIDLEIHAIGWIFVMPQAAVLADKIVTCGNLKPLSCSCTANRIFKNTFLVQKVFGVKVVWCKSCLV